MGTTPKGFPYPSEDDNISEGADAIKALADTIDTFITPVAAKANAALPAKTTQVAPAAGKVSKWDGNGVLAFAKEPIYPTQVANKSYVDRRNADVDRKVPGKITINTTLPSGGNDGDIWFMVV